MKRRRGDFIAQGLANAAWTFATAHHTDLPTSHATCTSAGRKGGSRATKQEADDKKKQEQKKLDRRNARRERKLKEAIEKRNEEIQAEQVYNGYQKIQVR